MMTVVDDKNLGFALSAAEMLRRAAEKHRWEVVEAENDFAKHI